MFVRAIDGECVSLGIGKRIDGHGSICSVEFFEAPTSDTIVHEIGADLLVPETLPEQTRIYHFNPSIGSWEIGRLLDDHGDKQYVKFPNESSGRWIGVSDTFIRWALPIADPTPFLAGKINETPRFSEGRSGFVRSMISQRAAVMGMSALASSAIELEHHQIEVVRRVLQDPVQRYLLADEVGLGKTIEAGILIRQCVLDSPEDTQILVVVPDSLVFQWRGELISKFFLGHCLDKSLHVLPLSDAVSVKTLLPKIRMLVVDEAHQLTRQSATVDPTLYADIAAAAPRIERVLLLSATPALHNERGLLKMLHLLDPASYPLEDEAGFRRRIESRQVLAEIVAGLAPDNALFIDELLDQLVLLFPDDRLLQNHANALRTITDTMPTENDPGFVSALGLLKAHLSEVYRLHRRVLRHRRRSIGGLTPERSGATIIDYHSGESANLANAIEDWRFAQIVAVGDDGDVKGNLGRVLAGLLGRQLEHSQRGAGAVGSSALQAHVLGDSDQFELTERLFNDTAIFDARLDALTGAIQQLIAPRLQFVVFCTGVDTADAIATELADRLKIPVDRHDPSGEGWLEFNFDSSRTILVCDERAEDGLNLQGGHRVIVHYDLPLNPNRIEQRLGRADRYGSGEAIRSIVLNCVDNPIEGAWIRYLDRGLRVFERSIASLQYLIDETTRALGVSMFADGIDALLDLTEASEGEDGDIDREIRNIDQQDALDSLGAPTESNLDTLFDVDGDWSAIEQEATSWIEKTLHFERFLELTEPGKVKDASLFRYRYATSKRHHTLIPLETFLCDCKSSIDLSQAAKLAQEIRTVPMTFSRRSALNRTGRSSAARLLRYGDPFISGMWEIAENDDRGRSTAMWRHIAGYQSQGIADLFFRFDYVLSADIAGAVRTLAGAGRDGLAAKAAIRRRGDMALPPAQKTIWLDNELELVTDSKLLGQLSIPYRPNAVPQSGRDFNLNQKRWRNMGRLDIPEQDSWDALCYAARQKSEAILLTLPTVLFDLNEAVVRASEVDLGLQGQLLARAERSRDLTDKAECVLEANLSQNLQDGIKAPHVHLDAIFAYFITGNESATAKIDQRS